MNAGPDPSVVDYEIIEHLGVKLPIFPGVMSEEMQGILRAGEYERAEAKRLPRLIEPGERLVELGAGIGFLSTLAAQAQAASIVVFEANPELIPVIEATHRLNGVQSIVRNAVVAPVKLTETTPFYLHRNFWASSLTPVKPKHLRGVVEVPIVTVEAMLREHAPTLLVMDIEGGEADLLDGAELHGVRKVYMELHPKVMGQAGVKRVFDRLSAQGFVYDIGHSSGGVVLFRRLEG
jgi:FkbM family methyltransferase